MKLDILEDIRVASPCQVSWEAMNGDDRVRFCDRCGLNVYDISTMTGDDALALVNEREGNLCVRFHRRKDGTVITSDCPVGRVRRLQRLGATIAASFAFVFFSVFPLDRLQSRGKGTADGMGPHPAVDRRGVGHFLGRPQSQIIGKAAVIRGDIDSRLPTSSSSK